MSNTYDLTYAILSVVVGNHFPVLIQISDFG